MSFVPTLCLECWRVMLVSLADAHRGELGCKFCGGEVRVVPGCSFGATDREQFEELSEIVAEGVVTPTEAQSFAGEAQRALWSGAYTQYLEKLSVRLLGLLPMQVAAGRNSGAQRRILLKLRTIFEALATVRRTSAEYPLVPGPSPRQLDKS